jgi:hypothetical protein
MGNRDQPSQSVSYKEMENVPIVIYVVQMNTMQGDTNSDRETGEDSFRGTGSSLISH